MSRSARRAALILALAPLALLAACGEEGTGDAASADPAGLDAVTISGDFGAEPKVTWKQAIEVTKTEQEVLIEGDGETLEVGEETLVDIWVGNGFSQSVAFSTFAEGGGPELVTLGPDIPPGILAGVQGHTIGSRVAVASPAKDAFGEQGNAQLGLGNGDSVLFIIDINGPIPSEPSGTDQQPAAWAPAVVEDGDVPGSLDFTGTPKPTDTLQVTTLIEGDGDRATAGQNLFVNYVGQVYGGKKPFDSSFARGEPFSFPLGKGSVIAGWDKGLEGIPVGSRVIIAVPPADGYGTKGNEGAGIKGTDTLYFLVDVLAAL